MTIETRRRGFLQAASAALVGLAGWPWKLDGQAKQANGAGPNEEWLLGLNGKHRQIFDVAVSKDGRPLGRVANFLDAYTEAYGVKDADLNAIFGVHGAGLPIVLNDAIWAKYELGRRNGEADPLTKAPAARNPWAKDGPSSVARLRERGVRFIVCQRSIRRFSGELAPKPADAERIRAELLANLLPGVIPVPAMIVAVNRAQEAGLSYAYLG